MSLNDDADDVIDFWVKNYYSMKEERDWWESVAKQHIEMVRHYESEMKRLERLTHG